MLKIRFTLFLVMALALLATPLAAQGYGQYVILSAQYGHERNHVDVTNRLRELARADRPIRISNNVFGVDPDPGVVKLTFAKGASLEDPARLFNSSLDGNVRRAIDIHEGEVVDEANFKALVRQAIALNSLKPPKKKKA